MLTVEKIGGTSMSRFDSVLENIILNKKRDKDHYNRIFVVSAYANVTNWLLENKKTGEPGIYSKFVENNSCEVELKQFQQKLIDFNKNLESTGLNLEEANKFISERIEQTGSYLNKISELIGSGYVDKQNILLAARELLASIGEAHSAFNSSNILNNNGMRSIFVDLSGFHDSDYLSIDGRIHRTMKNIDFSNVLPVVTGYTKGTEGIMREFDRGYTEVTFSKIALDVNAGEAIIHKEYHLCSADPNIVGVDNAFPVCFTNYDVADQLADIWMEAIHPKVSKALELGNINLRVKNTFDPDHPGTLISKKYKAENSKVELVSGTDCVIVIEIHDPSMVGEVGFDFKIMELFKKYDTSYILKATNANSISMVIWERTDNDNLIEDLKSEFLIVTVKKVAVVCVMGSNIDEPSILAKTIQVFSENNIEIYCLSLTLRRVNIQFAIERDGFEKAIIALNRAFFLDI